MNLFLTQYKVQSKWCIFFVILQFGVICGEISFVTENTNLENEKLSLSNISLPVPNNSKIITNISQVSAITNANLIIDDKSKTNGPKNSYKDIKLSTINNIIVTTSKSQTISSGTNTEQNDNILKNVTTEKINTEVTATSINEKNGSMITDYPSQNPDIINATNTSTTTIAPAEPVLPDKDSAEEEHNSSMSIFFVLCVLALGILLIHLMLQTNFQYLPESVVIVFLGAAIGMIINLMSHQNIANWRKEEAFSPTAFFLVLLPPIIFESGYNLHKGNFFQNIGSILVFAIVGTAISAFVIGAGIYLLGLAQVAYRLSFVESFAFGSLISAVDPVATVAIFHALEVDPILNMLVFGESILNDAISIVLTTSVLESNNATTTSEAIILGINRFCLMFFASAGIGVVFALISALLLKHVDLRKNPSLEFGMMLVFTYAPYVLAEGIQLSGKNLFW